MIIFRDIPKDEAFALLCEGASLLQTPLAARAKTQEIVNAITGASARILEEAEAYSLSGNLWRVYFTFLLCKDENVLGRAAELDGMPSETLRGIALRELASLCGVVTKIQDFTEGEEALSLLTPMSDYRPSRKSSVVIRDEARALVSELSGKIFGALEESDPNGALDHLISFYKENGSGLFALHAAFKWRDESACLEPIIDREKDSLMSLVGYEKQKAELRANTELFLSGNTANNVLLYGDSGTGKSSSVKALLNEQGYVRRGLRVIEVHKEQQRKIGDILNKLRGRKYRFILFMDDLSFEEFEVEYKYLKALIEGGLERKPDNVLIYATSNRRKLIREVWKDRKASSDDVHGWDTMQEKHSLADRFGVTIWYGAAEQDLYLEMVRTMARAENINIPGEELGQMALRWEVGRGGYTGRAARQFIQYVRRLGPGAK